jgi:hypothetical protein
MKRYEKTTSLEYVGTSIERPITNHRIWFDSYSEFIAECHAQKPTSHNVGFVGGGQNNFAQASYETAYRYATTGYADGAKRVKLKLEHLDVKSHIAKPEMYFDVAGDYGFDMGLVMSGEPENVICYRPSNELRSKQNGKIIKIMVNTVMSASIPKDIVAHRGAGIISLIDALETAGKRVQLDVICSAKLYELNALFTHEYPLKNASEALVIEDIAFALTHPAIERRFNFIALDLFPKSAGWSTYYSYGGPIDADHSAYDIYVPMLYGSDANWQTVATTDKWIRDTLAKLGVALDSDSDESHNPQSL